MSTIKPIMNLSLISIIGVIITHPRCLSSSALKKTFLPKDLGQKTFLGANPSVSLVDLVGTPAVVAGLVVVSKLAAARSFAMAAARFH